MRDEDGPAWDRFVRQSLGGTFFHLSGWRKVFGALHLDAVYMLAEQDGVITAVLPMVHQKSRLFGHALIAAPFCTQGGPLAADAASLAAIDAAACKRMDECRASYIEYRSRMATRPGWAVKENLYATFSRPIHASDEENLLMIPRKERAVIRHAIDSGLASDVTAETDAFFRVYSQSMRNLGTPVFPKRYFRALQEAFGADCDIVVVSDRGRPMSAVMNFYFGDAVLPYYGGGIPAARGNGANSFLYWEVMRRAARRGCRRFDFGRSKAGTGAFAFKQNWGFEPQWLAYEYRLRPGQALPQKNPLNPKYRAWIALWKHLPLPLANVLGPLLIRNLG